MPEDFGTPNQGQESEQERRPESQRDRYKRQRDEARLERDNASQLLRDQSDARLEKMEKQLHDLVGPNNGKNRQEKDADVGGDPWANLSGKELQTIINNAEYRTEQPELINNAMLELMKRDVRSEVSNAKKEVTESFNSDISNREGIAQQKAAVVNKYGTEAFDPSGPLFQAANSEYRNFETRHGKDDVAKHPEFILHAMDLAAARIGWRPKGSTDQSDTTDLEPQDRRPVGPDPRDRVEGLPEGHAERISERGQLLKDKDTRGVLESISSQLYG